MIGAAGEAAADAVPRMIEELSRLEPELEASSPATGRATPTSRPAWMGSASPCTAW